jgi:hypothetical protein
MLAVVNPAGQIGRAARTRGGSPPPCGRQSSGLDHGNGWLITGGFDAVEYGLDKRESGKDRWTHATWLGDL